MQDANTSDLIFGVDKIVSFLSQGTTIEAGTVILTGTPSVSFLLPFGVYFRQPF